MLKTILNLKGVHVLNKNKQQTVNGGGPGQDPYDDYRACYTGPRNNCICRNDNQRCYQTCVQAGCGGPLMR